MKKDNIRIIQRFLILVVSIFLLGLSTTNAQIGQLGIYGSVPEASRSSIRYVLIETNPAVDEGFSMIVPVNGLGNFNIYYSPDGMGFVPAGSYRIYYLNASRTTNYGYDDVGYIPNSGHTNGVQVRAFNSPPSTPRGIHGVVYGYNSLGSVVALHDLTVWSYLGADSQYAKTNGAGYFSVYYANGIVNEFLGTGDHRDVWITGSQDGCNYVGHVPGSDIIWSPDTNPSSPGYYVTNAEMDVTNLLAPLLCN
ncbi:hypothetical protein BH10ACI3_BH10ACI3_21220 [soil metagenome]